MTHFFARLVGFFFRILFLFVITGCVTQQKMSQHLLDQELKQLSARYSDIPICINAKRINSSGLAFSPDSSVNRNLSESSLYLSLEALQTYDYLVSFYAREMDLEGWQLISSVLTTEAFFYYQKPIRWCAIIIKNLGTVRIITLFSGSIK